MPGKVKQVLIRMSWALSIPLVSLIHILSNRYRDNTHLLKTVIDDYIPFCKLFILPYLSWKIYIFAVLLFLAIVNGRYYYRLVVSLVAGMLLSCLIFYFYPTTVIRPEVVGSDFLSQLVRFVYRMDNPYNCFPSLHVVYTFLATVFFLAYYRGKVLRILSLTAAFLISISTLLVKQHYFPDVILALLVGWVIFAAVQYADRRTFKGLIRVRRSTGSKNAMNKQSTTRLFG